MSVNYQLETDKCINNNKNNKNNLHVVLRAPNIKHLNSRA